MFTSIFVFLLIGVLFLGFAEIASQVVKSPAGQKEAIMPKRLYLDTETFSKVSITNGLYRYAEEAELLLLICAIDNGPIQVFDIANGEQPNAEVIAAINDPAVEIWAHNSNFDRIILAKTFPCLAAPERWHDTMVIASTLNLPGSLEFLCEFCGVPADSAKDKVGKKLIDLFCKPQKKNNRLTAQSNPEEWENFKNVYGRKDVAALREIAKRLPSWNYGSQIQKQFWLDQMINDRGFLIDRELAEKAVEASAKIKADADETISSLTSGAVTSVGQCERMLKFAADKYGYCLKDFAKATLNSALEDSALPDEIRRLIEIRLEAGKSSIKKFETLLKTVNSDNRLRGCLKFAGASRTLRWSGRYYQPQNMPRGTMKPDEVETAITAIKDGTICSLEAPMAAISNCIRGAVIAPEANKLVVADLSNIEGRVLAYLANEEWKLDNFKKYDGATALAENETDPLKKEELENLAKSFDPYRVTYARAIGKEASSVTKSERQIGKTMELGLGYGGGVSAFMNFAGSINLEEMADNLEVSVPEKFKKEADEFYEWMKSKGRTNGIPKKIYVAIESLKRLWRASNSNIVNLWNDVGNVFTALVKGQVEGSISFGGFVFDKADNFVRIKLPSGRYLPYFKPSINEQTGELVVGAIRHGKFGFEKIYPAMIVQHICQSTARDILANAMIRVEADGYPINFSVHDELICSVPDKPEFSCGKLAKLMSTPPVWAPNIPLSADGYEAYRYRK